MVLANCWKTCKAIPICDTMDYLSLTFKLFLQFISVNCYAVEHSLIPDITNCPLLLSFPLFGNWDLYNYFRLSLPNVQFSSLNLVFSFAFQSLLPFLPEYS